MLSNDESNLYEGSMVCTPFRVTTSARADIRIYAVRSLICSHNIQWIFMEVTYRQIVENKTFHPNASNCVELVPVNKNKLPVAFSFRPYHGPGVDSAPSGNKYQEHFLGGKDGQCVGLTTSPPSCAECHEI
jgi:hypothetical protein